MSADNFTPATETSRRKVVVIGGGFAGMAVVGALRDSDAEVTLVDRNNHHLFQPFLFQVATSILEPAEIATPIRSLVSAMPNVRVEMREAKGVDITAAACRHERRRQPPVRRARHRNRSADELFRSRVGMGATCARIENTFRRYCRAQSALNRIRARGDRIRPGQTGARHDGSRRRGRADRGRDHRHDQRVRATDLVADFRNIDIRRARIVLVEAGPRLLPAFSERHSSYATRALERAGVEVRLGVPVTHVDAAGVTIGEERIEAATVLWCTGVQGVALARTLGVNVKANGTVAVEKDFSVPGHPDCFVVGDAAHVIGPDGRALPGLASVAQHQGRYVGKLIAARLAGSALPTPPEPFVPSKLATITRHVGIAEYGDRSITGFPAWLMWGLLHLRTLSDGHSKLSILANWLRLLITYRRSARLIIERNNRDGGTASIGTSFRDNRQSARLTVASSADRTG